METITVPIWEKITLSLEEASAYFGIGLNKLREITNKEECEHCILWVGKKRMIKRELFEKYLLGCYSI